MAWRVDDLEDGIRIGGCGDGERLTVVQVVEERCIWAGCVHARFDELDGTLEPLVWGCRVRELVYARRLEGGRCMELCVPEVPEEGEHGEEAADVVRVPVGDDDIRDMLAWGCCVGIVGAVFESAFEMGDIAWRAPARVDEYIRGFLADEVGICPWRPILSQRKSDDYVECGSPCNVNFPGFCRSSETVLVC